VRHVSEKIDREYKNTLGATEVFIADLIACATCFGHHYAHHQKLQSIIQWLLVYQVKTNKLQQLKARLNDPVVRKATICFKTPVQGSNKVGSILLQSGVSVLIFVNVGNRKKKLPEFICVMGAIALLHNEQIARYKFFFLDTNHWDACM